MLSNIVKELFNDPRISILSKNEFDLLLGVVTKLPNEEGLLKEIVMKGISIGKLIFGYDEITKQFPNDKQVVLLAVKKNGNALQYASHELQNDKEVVRAAACQNYRAFQYAAYSVKFVQSS